MRELLTECAKSAGADVVIYDRDTYQNMLMDETTMGSTICLISEIDRLEMNFVGNGVITDMPITVSFVRAVELERTAEENEATLGGMQVCFSMFIFQLVLSGRFGKNVRFPLQKYRESESDLNAIGWKGSTTLRINGGYSEC